MKSRKYKRDRPNRKRKYRSTLYRLYRNPSLFMRCQVFPPAQCAHQQFISFTRAVPPAVLICAFVL